MKITKARLKEIIKEDISKAAYRAGYEDAFQGRPYNKDSRMRELNPRMYDYGFSRGTDAAIEDNRRPDEIDQRLNEKTSAVEEKLTRTRLKKIIKEELTRQDKTDVKKMIKDELEKLLKKKEMKDQISELTKKILKKLYKDLSLEHPYIIDRIKI
jgi:uncharacterized membrane-anchored protein YjiN (DUF445 family)